MNRIEPGEAEAAFAESSSARDVRSAWRRLHEMVSAAELGRLLTSVHQADECATPVRRADTCSEAVRCSVSPKDLAHVWQKFHTAVGPDHVSMEIVANKTMPEWLPQLPLASVALPYFTKRERELSLQGSPDVTIGRAFRYLNSGAVPVVEEMFNTAQRRSRLKRSLDDFMQTLRLWYSPQLRIEGVNWLVPVETSLSDAGNEKLPESVRKLLPKSLLEEPGLVFLSLEFTRLGGRIQRRDIADVRVAYRRALREIDGYDAHDPWTGHPPPSLAGLSTYWMWQFLPSDRFRRFLIRLRRTGITNVGQLSVLDPAFLSELDKVEPNVWRKLVLPES